MHLKYVLYKIMNNLIILYFKRKHLRINLHSRNQFTENSALTLTLQYQTQSVEVFQFIISNTSPMHNHSMVGSLGGYGS